MNKQELINLVQANLTSTDNEILALVPSSTNALGRIDGANKLDLVTLVIGGGLDDRCDAMITANTSATHVEVATKIKKALNPLLLMSNQYWINLGVPAVKLLVDGASSGGVGLLTDTEYTDILTLATYVTNDTSWVDLTAIAIARDEIAKLAALANPTKITVTNPANAPQILKGRNDESHVVYVTITTPLAYTDNLRCTAASKNIQYDEQGQPVLAPFIESDPVRGNFVIPANWAGTKAFNVNKSGLENHILYSLQSQFNRVFTAEVKSL